MASYKEQLQRDGFVIIPEVLDSALVYELKEQLSNSGNAAAVSQRAGRTFAIRNLLNAVPLVQTVASSNSIRSLVALGLSGQFQIVRAIYFDKHKHANWKVAWHQDLTIIVRNRRDVEGYGPWSIDETSAGSCFFRWILAAASASLTPGVLFRRAKRRIGMARE